jgi:LAO/AO transport system kinase
MSDAAPSPHPRPQTHDGCPQPRPDWVPKAGGAGFATWVVEGVRRAGATRTPIVPPRLRPRLAVQDYVVGVIAGNGMILGRAITLAESNVERHRVMSQAVIKGIMPHTGKARRIGITGIPGAGKSTFIEALGMTLIRAGHRVAVLAVDPSSTVNGGSILADKVRMEKLGREKNAFIRPSPSSGSLGGVARKTREAILLCEAAGYDVVIVETVGVGKNEVTVRSMVDFFLVLVIAGAGDELQGIKKGVIELADLLVINKADGDNRRRCLLTQAELQRVLHFLHHATAGWETSVLLASALAGAGIDDVWQVTGEFFATVKASGGLDARRRSQAIEWMHALIDEGLKSRFYGRPEVNAQLDGLENLVAHGQKTPLAAARELLGA